LLDREFNSPASPPRKRQARIRGPFHWPCLPPDRSCYLDHAMDETFARVSKAGRVVCGLQHADGGFYCDEPLAALVKVHEPPRYAERRLVALPGWRPSRKAIWRRTTSAEDRRSHGRPSPEPAGEIDLPALVCCPKCGTVQWFDGSRLNVRVEVGTAAAPSRWAPPTR